MTNYVPLILLRFSFFGTFFLLTNYAEAFKRGDQIWTAKTYPDIRQNIYKEAVDEHSCGKYEFLCDPDGILTKDQGNFSLNSNLILIF